MSATSNSLRASFTLEAVKEMYRYGAEAGRYEPLVGIIRVSGYKSKGRINKRIQLEVH